MVTSLLLHTYSQKEPWEDKKHLLEGLTTASLSGLPLSPAPSMRNVEGSGRGRFTAHLLSQGPVVWLTWGWSVSLDHLTGFLLCWGWGSGGKKCSVRPQDPQR